MFLIYNEIPMGSGVKSYIRKGFLIYEEMRKFFPVYEEAVRHIWLCNQSLLIPLYIREILFYFLPANFGMEPHSREQGFLASILYTLFYKKRGDQSPVSKYRGFLRLLDEQNREAAQIAG
jgi:hypothetical protein